MELMRPLLLFLLLIGCQAADPITDSLHTPDKDLLAPARPGFDARSGHWEKPPEPAAPPVVQIDPADLQNVCIAAHKALGLISTADAELVIVSLKRVEQLIEKLKQPAAAPKPKE